MDDRERANKYDPEMVTTTNGLTHRDLLTRKVIVVEDDNELTHAIEYRLKAGSEFGEEGELVHRSVHVQLKRNVAASGIAAMMS